MQVDEKRNKIFGGDLGKTTSFKAQAGQKKE